MSYDIYSKGGYKLPYLIDTDIERWLEDGNKECTRYIRKWAVLGTEANEFVTNLTTSY